VTGRNTATDKRAYRRRARTLAGIEDATSAWVHWYNANRLMHRLGRRPPAEAEAEYYAHHQVGQHTDHT
jgi:hypothetical protein